MPRLFWSPNSGPSGQQSQALLPGQNLQGQTAIAVDPSDITYPAPGGGLLRVPVGGGIATPINGTLNGQLWQYDNTAGLWTPTPTAPSNGQVAQWNSLANSWQFFAGMFFLRQTLIQVAGAGNHVCLPQATHAECFITGSGGAGGGANAAAGNASVGGGASAGGTAKVLLDLIAGGSLTIPYVIGAQALGVIGAAGPDGNNSTITYNAVVYTGGKGIGSIPTVSGNTILFLGVVLGGVALNGDVNFPGGCGGIAVREGGTSGVAGNGGSSLLAQGPAGASAPLTSNASANGNDAILGCGGSGAVNFNDAPAAGNRGGNGGIGWLLVNEYRRVP